MRTVTETFWLSCTPETFWRAVGTFVERQQSDQSHPIWLRQRGWPKVSAPGPARCHRNVTGQAGAYRDR